MYAMYYVDKTRGEKLGVQEISYLSKGCHLLQEFRIVLFNSRHEDGTVRFWDASSTAMKLIYKMGTAAIFGCDFAAADQSNADGEEQWPPFRKVTVTLLLCVFVLLEILTKSSMEIQMQVYVQKWTTF